MTLSAVFYRKGITMKKFLWVFVLFCCGFIVYAQDIITLKTGEEIEAVVQEINVDSVKYKKPDTEGPVYTILKSEIFMIKYAGGEKETFKDVPAQPAVTTVIAVPPDNFNAGQRWGAWALNSFLVPGLGSYVIMHDWTGGSVMLGLGIVGGIFFGVGVSNILGSVYTTYEYDYSRYDEYTHTDSGKMIRGSVFVGVGFLFLLADSIFSIVRCAGYDKPAPKAKVTQGFNPARLNVVLLPGENDAEMERVQVSYTLSF